MYKMIVVDDEAISRIAIMNIIDWEAEGFLLLEDFENGQEALEYLVNHEVDLVITDIKMPIMDGLTLIEEAKKNKLDAKFILLTAFDEFDYVRVALRNGALSYILKLELEKEELIELLAKIKETLAKDRPYKNQENIVDKKTEQGMRWAVLRELMYGHRVANGPVIPVTKEYEITFLHKQFYLVLFVVDIERDIERDRNITFMLEELFDDDSIYVTWTSYNEISILFNSDKKNMQDMMTESNRWINRVKFIIKEYYNIEPTFYMSDIHYSFTEINQAYLEAYNTKKQDHDKGGIDIIRYCDIEEKAEPTDYILLEKFILDLERGLHSDSIETIEIAMDNIKQIILNTPTTSLYTVKNSLSTAVITVNSYLQKNNTSKELFWGNCDPYGTLHHLKDRQEYVEFVQRIFERCQKILADADGNYIVKQAKAYLKLHYAEAINFTDVANEVGITVTYLSSLFKKVTGQTLKDFQIGLRLGKAMELLRGSNQQVAEISVAVGYENEQYFSRFFKQKTGMTPSQYRNAEKKNETKEM